MPGVMAGVRGLAAAFCLIGVVAAAPASAAEQLGATGTAGLCDDNQAYVSAGVAVPGVPDYAANAPGVITSWSMRADADAASVRFTVFRPDSGTAPPFGYTPVQRDVVRSLPVPNADNTFTGIHLPIATGQLIGVFVPNTQPFGDGGCLTATPGEVNNRIQGFGGDPPFGVSSNFGPPLPNLRPNLAAVVEPDADGDRFGDETQDGCPTNAAVQTACPVPATPAKKCKKRKKKSKKSDASAAKKKKKRGCRKRKKK
jgi:hypothetical protein